MLLIRGFHSCCIKSGIGHVVCSITDDSLRFHGLQPSMLLCPWNLGCHFLLQEIFPTQGWNAHLMNLLHWQEYSLLLLLSSGYQAGHLIDEAKDHCFRSYPDLGHPAVCDTGAMFLAAVPHPSPGFLLNFWVFLLLLTDSKLLLYHLKNTCFIF